VRDAYALHEDNWRQVEFVDRSCAEVVEQELTAVRQIYRDHGRADENGLVFAFSMIYVRRRPEVPLMDPPPLDELARSLPAPDRTFEAVAFAAAGPSIAASFAMAYGPIVVYGLARGGHADALCLRASGLAGDGGRLARHLAAFMRRRDLMLVDWPQCLALTADNVAEYL
jgi:hypothetical protein